jgi:DNA-binding NtrC family response regulator
MAKKRILLVDDDDIVLTMLESVLSTVGYAVDTAMTAAAARAHLAAISYSLVIADWRLPDGDGAVVADSAAQLGAKTVLISGYGREMSAEVRGGHPFMMKPVGIGTLLSCVSDAIGGPYLA